MSLGDSATPLGKVRGLGSAREGGEHWLTERVTSIALAAARHLADRLAAVPARARPATRRRMAARAERRGADGAADHHRLPHALDGMKVVVDDYVHEEGNRFALNTLLLFLAVGGGALALFALGPHRVRSRALERLPDRRSYL